MRLTWQHDYILFGIEWDLDVDDRNISFHLWPITIEWMKEIAK